MPSDEKPASRLKMKVKTTIETTGRTIAHAALDAVHCEAFFCQQGGVDAGSGTQLQDGPGGWMKFADQARDIFGLRRIVLVPVEQVVIAGVVGEYRCAVLHLAF